jgi:hypothetical protein
MFHHVAPTPDLVPQLSRGKHRNPRKGACFMELASYLAGERWSDHPACTHPLLASLARLVNDHTSDERRTDLARLVPSVIGLTTDEPLVYPQITLRSAITALSVAAAERQRVLAASVLATGRMLADHHGPVADGLKAQIGPALDDVPDAARWARSFSHDIRISPSGYRRYAAPNTVRLAVVSIASACIPDPDALLHDLLDGAIADCRQWTATTPAPEPAVDTDVWEGFSWRSLTASGRRGRRR